MLGVTITPADVQDRDGFIPLLKEMRRVFVFLQRIFADGGYSGAKTAAEAKRAGKVDVRPPFSALFTLWLSTMAAVGLASLPARLVRAPLGTAQNAIDRERRRSASGSASHAVACAAADVPFATPSITHSG